MGEKNRLRIVVNPKGQFLKIWHISKEVCRIFSFVDKNSVLVEKLTRHM